MMMFLIVLCMTFFSQGGCLKEMNGVRCQTVQEAGEHLAENIDKFDKLLQEVVMRCYEESKELTKSALKRLTADLKNVKLAKSTGSGFIHFVCSIYSGLFSYYCISHKTSQSSVLI